MRDVDVSGIVREFAPVITVLSQFYTPMVTFTNIIICICMGLVPDT